METVTDFIFLDSKVTTDGDCSHQIKWHLLLGGKAVSNLDSIIKSRDITLPTKVHLFKAMVFPAVMYRCESWIIKKAAAAAAAAAAAKSLQLCPTLCNVPEMAAHQASLYLGFSRQEYWSGLPFFSNACMQAKLLQLCPTLCNSMDSNPPGSSGHRIL